MKTILFIDGRNFIDKISSVLNPNKEKDIDFSIYNFSELIDKTLSGINIDKKIFYFGKLIKHPETVKKSEELIEKQRKLKTHLEEQGFEVVIAGRVRGHIEKCIKGHETLTFREKGVDVRIAVDMITSACDKGLKTAIIGSIYLGFEDNPNKGLTFTTNRTILIRNSEVFEFAGKILI